MNKAIFLFLSISLLNFELSFSQEADDLKALEAELLGITTMENRKETIALERKRSREMFHDALMTFQSHDFENALTKFDSSLVHGLKWFPAGHHLPQAAYVMKAWAHIRLNRFDDADEILKNALEGFQNLNFTLESNEIYSSDHFYYKQPYEYFIGTNKDVFISNCYIFSKFSQGQYPEALSLFDKTYEARKKKIENGVAKWDSFDLEFFQTAIPVLCNNYQLELANELVIRSDELIDTLNIQVIAPTLVSRSKINKVVVLKTSGEFKQAESLIIELLKEENTGSLTTDEIIMLQLYHVDILIATNQDLRAQEILDEVALKISDYPPLHALKIRYTFSDIAKYNTLPYWPIEIDQLVEKKLTTIIEDLENANQGGRIEYWNAVYLLFNYFENRVSSGWSQFKYTDLLEKILDAQNAPPSIQFIANIRKAIQLIQDEDYSASKIYAIKSLNMAEVTGNPIELTSIHTILAKLSSLLKESDEAKHYNKLLQNDIVFLISNYNYYLNELNREKFWKSNIAVPVSYYKDYCVNNFNNDKSLIDSLLNFQINTKGALLKAGQNLNNRVRNSNDPKVHELYAQHIALKNQYSLLMNEPFSEKRILTWNKLNLVESNLANMLGEDFKEKYLGWEEIKNQLSEDQTAIEIIRIHNDDQVRYVYLTLSGISKQPSISVLELSEKKERKFLKTYENLIKYNVESELIYDELFHPFLDNIPTGSEIILSVDGIYNKINPNTLKKSGAYLIDKFKFTNVTSLRSIHEQKPMTKDASSKDVYLIGRPEYYDKSESESDMERSGSTRWYANESFADLPGTQIEVESISSILAQSNLKSVLLLGNQASESSLKELDNPYMLHVATHGYFINSDSHSSYLPMMNSGLVMANAGHDFSNDEFKEDGFLTAFELSSLNLTGTKLTVFSACESGLGEVANGEGVYGLGRALHLAGSEFSILSLWKVDDNATKDLMINLYEEILKTQNIKQSFHDAQIITREKYPAPRYWGAFILYEN